MTDVATALADPRFTACWSIPLVRRHIQVALLKILDRLAEFVSLFGYLLAPFWLPTENCPENNLCHSLFVLQSCQDHEHLRLPENFQKLTIISQTFIPRAP